MNGSMTVRGIQMIYLMGWGWVGADVVVGVVELGLPAVGGGCRPAGLSVSFGGRCGSHAAVSVILALRLPLLPDSLLPPCFLWM